MHRVMVFAAVVALLVILAFTQAAAGGRLVASSLETTPDSLMFGRTTLVLNALFTSGASASTEVGWGAVENRISGFGGGIGFQRWFRDDLAATFSIGGTAVEVLDVTGPVGVRTQTASSAPVLFGLRYHPESVSLGDAVFPFLAVAVGPYIGVETRSDVFTNVKTTTTVEVAVGAHLAAGFDLYLWRHFNIAVGFGYNAITDYGQDIGSTDNHSGAEMSLSFGWVF